MDRAKALLLAGVVLVCLGIAGFAVPVFTTQKTEDVAHLGDLKLQATHGVSHRIPSILSGGVLVFGFILIAISLSRKV